MIIVQSILKELSARRILTYAQIEARLEAFEYGQNDQSNKPPTVRPKHLTNNHIPGSASQKLLLFQMLPIIFHDVINRLIDLLPIYTCLREIVSIVFATRIRKSWLPYLTSVTISFHSLMIDKLPDNITAKVHFITHYPELIKRNGPPQEEIDGHLLQKLRFEEIKSLFPKLKQRAIFLDEREKLSYKLCSEKIQSNPTPIDDDDQEEQSLFVDENMKSSDSIPFVDEVVIENIEVSSSNSSNNHSDDEENDDQLIEKEIKLQEDYELPPFPTDLKFVIDQKDFTKLAAHSNLRRVLLNLVYDDIANKHHLLYPKSQDYIVITKAILRSLNIPVDNKDALNEYRESIKQKFKNERKPLQKINAQVQRNKNKFGKGPGRPVKKTDLVSAERKNEKLMFIGQLDDEQDMFKLNQMLKDEFNKKPVNMEALTYFWKKTFTYRRLFTRNNVIKEVLLEYPAYSLTSLVFEEVRMTTDTDIERNVELFLPMLFEKLPDNSMFISDVLPIRVIKLLYHHFKDPVTYALTEKVILHLCIF
ncbi:unnamed protein product [Rotaria sp. Silwood2]|nr:unnamed protein product [Rotaria sp. Silwood2]